MTPTPSTPPMTPTPPASVPPATGVPSSRVRTSLIVAPRPARRGHVRPCTCAAPFCTADDGTGPPTDRNSLREGAAARSARAYRRNRTGAGRDDGPVHHAGVPGAPAVPGDRTWERSDQTGRTSVFVDIPGFCLDRHGWLTCSHVRRGGAAHMGERTLPQVQPRFRRMARFSGMRRRDECATPRRALLTMPRIVLSPAATSS